MKIPYQNKEIEVVELEPVTSNEPWCEYQLPDGKILCTKAVMVAIYKAVDEKTPDGGPLYITKTQGIMKIK